MTDKEQIIIDGVNVSRCKFFNDITESYYCFGIPCKDRPNCYFKQLARKVQECERVLEAHKILSDEYKRVSSNLCEDNKRLEQEREELQSESFTREELISLQEKDIDCYRKALEEIEEIVKGMRSVFMEEISITASQLNDRIYRESTARFRQILDIINKAKERSN